jgi:protease-4
MRLLGRIIMIILAAIGSAALLFAGVGLWAVLKERPNPLPAQMVLMLDLNAGVAEAVPDGPLGKFALNNAYLLTDVVAALDKASRDPAVTAVVAKLDDSHLGMAKAQEIRDAVLAFRKSGKRAVVYSTSLGDFGGATVAYYLASAFQEVWLQPSGDVGLTGFMAESPFLHDALDLLGIKPEFGARWEYKSAIDMFTQKQFTKENREAVTQLVNAWTAQTVEGIATARGLKSDQVLALIDRAPLLADEAREAGLVDRLAYWDELEKSLTDGGAKMVDLADYAARVKPEPTAVKVALIYGVGAVQRADGQGSPLSDNAVFSADKVTKAFRLAVKDPEVKAILFRINSPGGSYTASDSIWREVVNARAAGKPVIVWMGDVAASGGYFAAMAADRIIAQPGTITGSIGVFAGKMVLSDLWKKLGVNWDEVHTGQNAAMWSSNSPFSPTAWQRVNAMLDHIYGDFTGKAEQGRNLKPEDMDKIARGRVWSGDDARKLGLVDQTGGYSTVVVAIRQLAHLPLQMPVDLVPFPKTKEPLDYLMDLVRTGHAPEGTMSVMAVPARLARLAAALRPLATLLDANDQASDGALRMPPLDVK